MLKAMTEGWDYHLNIRKPMLREWQKAFARSGGSGADDRPSAVDRSVRACPVATPCAFTTGVAHLPDGPARAFARRSRATPGNTQSSERGHDRQAGIEHVDGAQAPRAFSHFGGFVDIPDRGGTCLAKVHAGFYRLSEDLDFSISRAN
jgi:Nucleotidyl transferase AbiEii toxin, Type IV TA system